MVIRKRNTTFFIDWKEPVNPFRRLRQSFKKGINQSLAWKIGLDLETAYLNKTVDPFNDPHFNINEWYLKGRTAHIINVEQVIEEFLTSKKPVVSIATLKTYKHYLNFWKREMNLSDSPISTIKKHHIEPVLLRSETSSKSKDSFKRHLAAFFSFCIDKGYAQHNPVKEIALPRVKSNTVQKMSSTADIELIFSVFDEYKKEQLNNRNYRKRWDMVWFKPIIALLRYAGLRREEAVTRKWEHYDGVSIYVEAVKGNNERYVPVMPMLKVYLEELKLKATSDWMFPNPIKPMQHISGETVYKKFKMICKRANLDSKKTIHGLRHAFVTQMINEKNLSTAEVKLLAGHSSVKVTEQYIHLDVGDIAKKMNL